MNPSDFITCAIWSCNAMITVRASQYIEGRGRVCRECFDIFTDDLTDPEPF